MSHPGPALVIRAPLFAAIVILAAIGVTACGGSSEPREPLTGAQIFSGSCAVCHRPDGGGGIGPKINEGVTITKYPDRASQIELVTKGRNAMPSFGSQLSPAEIEAVVDYVRTEL